MTLFKSSSDFLTRYKGIFNTHEINQEWLYYELRIDSWLFEIEEEQEE